MSGGSKVGSRKHLRFLGIDRSGMKNRFAGKGGGAWGMSCWEGGREESSCPLPHSDVNRPGGFYVKHWCARFSQHKSGYNYIILWFYFGAQFSSVFLSSLFVSCMWLLPVKWDRWPEVWASHHHCFFHSFPEIQTGRVTTRAPGLSGRSQPWFQKRAGHGQLCLTTKCD